MRKIREEEFEQATNQMSKIFFETPDILNVIKGIDIEKAKKVIYENLYWDMVYYHKYGDVFTYDDDFSGIVFLIDGKNFSFLRMAMTSLKASKKIKSILDKEEMKIFASNSQRVQSVHSFKWYKKRKNVPYYLAHIGIDAEKRGTGIFRKMMGFVFEHTKRFNTEIVLETFDDKNVSIYEHFGFSVVETANSTDKTLKEYRMMKTL